MKASKGERIMELFFDYPSKRWHFEEIVKEAHAARSKADKWLKRLVREGLINRVKEKKKMPYYISSYESPAYKGKKRIFALNKLYESGLLNNLYSLKKAKTIVIFGSFSRWDWYKDSDIDLFIYGDPEGLNIGKYEIKLHRDVQLFVCKGRQELKRLGKGLIRNIVEGDIIKGDTRCILNA